MNEEEFLNGLHAGEIFFSGMDRKLLEDLVNEYKTDSRKVEVRIKEKKLDRYKLLRKKIKNENS